MGHNAESTKKVEHMENSIQQSQEEFDTCASNIYPWE